jgi:hypothetical protein
MSESDRRAALLRKAVALMEQALDALDGESDFAVVGARLQEAIDAARAQLGK